MKIAIFCPKDSLDAAKIKIEAEKRGHSCSKLALNDIYVDISNEGLLVEHRTLELMEYDVFIFRKIQPNEIELVSIFAKFLKENGKTIIDETIINSDNHLTLLNNLIKEQIPVLRHVYTTGLKSSRDVLMELEHPTIVKPLDLAKERYTFSEDWTESYDIVRTEKSKRYEFVEASADDSFIRVYLINSVIVGAIKKTSLEPDRKLNLAKKSKISKYEVTPQLEEYAKKTAQISGYTMCSIDFIKIDDSYKIIEIDRSPKLLSFNKMYPKKLETYIIDYLETI